MRTCFLLCLLSLAALCLRAQTFCPEITPVGDTLFAPDAQSYQWYKDDVAIPGATGRFHVMTEPGVYTVTVRSLTSDPVAYESPTVVVTGAVLDEFLRPIAGAEVTVAGVKTNTDGDGRFYISAQRAQRLAARATIIGYHAHTVGFMPTAADTQFVMIHLAKNVVTHKLRSTEGGTISQGGFWLTLPPNAVVDEDGKPYSGEIQLSVVARRPGDRDFAQRMPGGDFMAVDKNGDEQVLYSYGFTGVEMQTPDGQPLNLAPDSTALIEFLITEDQRPGAPDEMPLWHFDETAGLWVEAGVVRKAGLTYKAEVPHFSWWNCDFPYEKAYLKLHVVNCWGQSLEGINVEVWTPTYGAAPGYSDENGEVSGVVPANLPLRIHVGAVDTTFTLAPEQHFDLGTINVGWGRFTAFGLADTNNVLTIYASGETEGVEYSLDGETWQSETTFVLEGDVVPERGMARLPGCDTVYFNNHKLIPYNDCVVYDYEVIAHSDLLASAGMAVTLLAAQEPIYRVRIRKASILPILNAALYQRCVQQFSFNDGQDLPEECLAGVNGLCKLWPNLMQLNLIDNNLISVPEEIQILTKLHGLSLVGNRLTEAPAWIGAMPLLEDLRLTDNGLGAFPEWIGGMTGLKNLTFGREGLTSVPATLANLTGLSSLTLDENALTQVPVEVQGMTGLETFNMTSNQLRALPEWLDELTELKYLYMGGNQLTGLPESLGGLPKLIHLYLGANQLTTIPASFADLADTLQYLDLRGNPISPEEQDRIRQMLPNTYIQF